MRWFLSSVLSWLSWFLEDIALAIDKDASDDVARKALHTRKYLPLG